MDQITLPIYRGLNPLKFEKTYERGKEFEDEVAAVFKQYSRHVYCGVKIDTNMTEIGHTEIDIVAALDSFIFIVEVKNVISIVGKLTDDYWLMRGKSAEEPYTAMNVFTQNRLHCEAFQQAWLSNILDNRTDKSILQNIEIPKVISIVVVRDGAEIPEELKTGGIFTLHELSEQLPSIQLKNKSDIGYKLDYLLGSTKHFKRSDFNGKGRR